MTKQITNGLTAVYSKMNQAWFVMFMGQQVLTICETLEDVDNWLIDHNMGAKCLDTERAKLYA